MDERTPSASESDDTDTNPQRSFGDVSIEPDARQLWRGDERIDLTRTEYDLLLALIDNHGRILSSEALVTSVWGHAWLGDAHVIETHIGRLRAKLGESGRHPRHIRTVRGLGYRFDSGPDGESLDAAGAEATLSIGGEVISVLVRITLSPSGGLVDVSAELVDEGG
jgi:DNA-binding response OmpR family regulator